MKHFLTALQTGLILFAMALSGTGWASENRVEPAAMTSGCSMRDTLVSGKGDGAVHARIDQALVRSQRKLA